MSDKKREDLKPCPFCGWGISFVASTSNHCVAVFCDNCLASASPNDEGEEAAITSWQARSALDQRQGFVVTDEMVEKACAAYWKEFGAELDKGFSEQSLLRERQGMRAALQSVVRSSNLDDRRW